MIKRIAILFSICLATNAAHANFIYDIAQDKGHVYMSGSLSTMMIAYDAATDHFSGLFEGDGFGVFLSRHTPNVDYRLSGTFNLDATISEDGQLSGGSVSWIGGGDGITAGTSLLKGNLTDFVYLITPEPSFPDLLPSVFANFDFIIQTTSSDPLLNLSESLYLRLYFSEGTGENLFQSSFVNAYPYTGQDLWSVNTRNIPEPTGIALWGLGLVILGLIRLGFLRRRVNR